MLSVDGRGRKRPTRDLAVEAATPDFVGEQMHPRHEAGLFFAV